MVFGVPLAAKLKVWLVPTVKLVMLVVVIFAPSWTVSEKFWVMEPELLLALKVMVLVPPVPAAGVPEITPVVAFRVRPLGSEPVSILKVGAGKPLAASVNEPEEPTVKVPAVALVKTGVSPTERVKFWLASLPTPLLDLTTIE